MFHKKKTKKQNKNKNKKSEKRERKTKQNKTKPLSLSWQWCQRFINQKWFKRTRFFFWIFLFCFVFCFVLFCFILFCFVLFLKLKISYSSNSTTLLKFHQHVEQILIKECMDRLQTSDVICFLPVDFPFCTPKNKFQWFQNMKSKDHTSSPSIFNFPPSLSQFSFFSSPFSLFLCLYFPGRLAKISQWKTSGGTLPPTPIRLLRHCFRLLLLASVTVTRKSFKVQKLMFQ